MLNTEKAREDMYLFEQNLERLKCITCGQT